MDTGPESPGCGSGHQRASLTPSSITCGCPSPDPPPHVPALLDPPHAIPEEQQQQQQTGGGISAAAALAALAAGGAPSSAAGHQEERLLESVHQLRDEVRQLRDRLDEERRRRQHLETVVRTHLLAGRADIRWDD